MLDSEPGYKFTLLVAYITSRGRILTINSLRALDLDCLIRVGLPQDWIASELDSLGIGIA